MPLIRQWRVIISLFTLAAVIYAARTKQSHGNFLGVPFEFRFPTVPRLLNRLWNPEDDRIFTPHVFGVGWSLNLYQLSKRLGLREDDEDLGEMSTED